jgi:hypothetical protein
MGIALLVDASSVTRLSQLDLATGRVSRTMTLPASNSVFYESASYTRPKGLALFVTTQTNDAQLLQRFSLTGALQRTYPNRFSKVGAFTGSVVSSADGRTLALGARRGIAFVGNDGSVANQVLVPGATYCSVKRWWSTTVVLASCAGSSSAQRLYKIPVAGGTAASLTAPPASPGPDDGDLNAWAVGSAVYVQDAGGCAYTYVARLQPDHLTTPVVVPHVVRGDSVFVVGVLNDELALQATVACGSGESALWFNPTTNTSTVVLGPPLNGGGVQAVVPYPDPAP